MTKNKIIKDIKKYELILKHKQLTDLIPIIKELIIKIDNLIAITDKTCQTINELINYYTFLNFITKFLDKNDEFFNLRDNVKEISKEIEALRIFEKNLFNFIKLEMTKDLYLIYPQNEKILKKEDENFWKTTTFLRTLEYIKIPILNFSIKYFCIDNFYKLKNKMKEEFNKKEQIEINGKKLINLMNFLEELIKINKSIKNRNIESCTKSFKLIKNFLDQFSLILFGNKDLINIYEIYLENLNILNSNNEKKEGNLKKYLKNYENYKLIDELKLKYNFCYNLKNFTYEKIQKQFITEFIEIITIDINNLEIEDYYLNTLVVIDNYEITKYYIEKEFKFIHKNLINNTTINNKESFIINKELFNLIDEYFKNPSSQLIFKYLNRDRLPGIKKENFINKINIKINNNNFNNILTILNKIIKRLTLKLEYSIIQKELETYYTGLEDIIYKLNENNNNK